MNIISKQYNRRKCIHKRTTAVISWRLPVKNCAGHSDVSYLEWTDRTRWDTCASHQILSCSNHIKHSFIVVVVIGGKH